jgi:glycolate oxidase
MESRVKQTITDIVGADNVTDALIDLVTYSYDASDHDHRPHLAVWPTTTEQVGKIMEIASTERFPVTPRGAGTGLSGAGIPSHGGIVMDLCRMNQILDIRVPDRLVVLQPGVVYEDLQRALAPHGFFFPPDPASGKVCTIGGNVATNAGGIRAAKYGVTRDYVLGLEVVLPDGRIMRTGSPCMKSVSGFDLTRLFVGSEGTLGIITEIILKINPKPLATKTALACFADLEAAGEAITQIMHSGIIPSVLEVLDENSIRVLREQGGFSLPDAKAITLVETDGYTQTEADFQMDKVVGVFKELESMDIQVADSAEAAEELWRARKSVGSAASKLRPNNISEDVTVPISRLADLLTGISRIVEKHGLPFVVFGHAGDGNIHPRIMFDRTDPDQVGHLEAAAREIFELSCHLGGTLTGEHGIGLAKAPYMGLEHDDVALDVMRSIKKLLDPHNVLNPGKMQLDR